MKEAIRDYQAAMGYPSESEAVRDLIDIGYKAWSAVKANPGKPGDLIASLPNNYKSTLDEVLANPLNCMVLAALVQYADTNVSQMKVLHLQRICDTNSLNIDRERQFVTQVSAKADRYLAQRGDPRKDATRHAQMTKYYEKCVADIADANARIERWEQEMRDARAGILELQKAGGPKAVRKGDTDGTH